MTYDEFDEEIVTEERRKPATAPVLLVIGGIILGAVITLGIVALIGSPFGTGDEHGPSMGAEAATQLWTCGMHPQVVEDEAGSCPICGMDLVPLRGSGMEEEHAHDHPEAGQLWTCGMHPQVVEDEAGSCPICGMDLVPLRDTGDQSSGGGPKSKGKILFYRNPMDPNVTSPVPRKDDMGMDYVPVYAEDAGPKGDGATVTINPVTQQNMNVVTEKVSRRDISRQIRTVGYLDYDQERMVSVTTKYEGFIEKTYVNYIGQEVTKGQPLFEIYSPDLVQTERELLAAKRYADRMAGAGAEVQERATALLEAARERLAYWDISPEQIRSLEADGEVHRTLQVTAPASGMVMKRMPGLEGMAVRPGMELLHLADISSLWLTVEVFEDQLPWIDIGSTATISLTYFPGEVITGRVRFIEPEVSETTRSLQMTLQIPNRRSRLRVGMYATVVFEPLAAKNAITVPSNAVLRTGERNVVIVALGEGRFAPREVVLGPQGDGFVQVLEGLSDGAEIVTSAQFLIDSESNLREAIQKMIAEKRSQAQGGGK